MLDINGMLTPAQLALCQADAIARLARLRLCATPGLTPLGHLSLEIHGQPCLPGSGEKISSRVWIQETLGGYGSNLVRVLAWEQRHQAQV